jgi:opacity protein-like surface antigen
MKRVIFLAISAVLLSSAAAQAQPRMNPDADGDGVTTRAEADAAATRMFGMLDRNSDGRLDQADRAGAPMGGDADGRGGRMQQMLQMLDGNRDGAVTREEFTAGMARRHQRLDTNGDGNVTETEREAGQAMRGERGGGRRPPQ